MVKPCHAGALAALFMWALPQAGNTQPTSGAKWTAPAAADRKHNPLRGNAAAAIEGKDLFVQNCLPCHGSKGDGDGPAAAFLDKHPGVLSDPKMWTESDGALFWKIAHGNTPMPAFAQTLTGEQRWALIDYLRTLAAKPAGYVESAAGTPKAAKTAATASGTATGTPVANAESEKQLAAMQAQFAASAAEAQALRRDLEAVKEDMKRQSQEAADLRAENSEAMDNLGKGLQETQAMAKAAYPGDAKMLIVGYGTAGFTGARTGDGDPHPVYDAEFNPLMIWKLGDRLLFEGEIELEMEGTETTVNLEVAQSSYLLCDYLTLGAGKFLNPMNFFVERQHMNWVNKLPDKPLAVYDGLLPESELGMQLRGVAPFGKAKLEYSAFAVNAPMLITDDSTAYGSLEFDNFDNVNGNIAYGGHVGFIPVAPMEIGYGMQTSEVEGPGRSTRVWLQSLDANYVQDAEPIKGLLSLRGQWVWSQMDDVTYDADHALGFGPATFDNFRQGGYAQVSYRPTKAKHQALRGFEPVVRWDAFYQRRTPVGFDEQRVAVGLDFWPASNVVAKAAYEKVVENGTGSNSDAFMAQFVSGF